MSVATSTAIGLGLAGAGIVGSVASSAIGAHAASSAANAQENSANYAAQLQAQEAQSSLNFQKEQYYNNLNLEMPWIQAGQGGLANLQYLLGIGGKPAMPSLATGGPQPSTRVGGTGGGGILGGSAGPGTNGIGTVRGPGGDVINGGSPRLTGPDAGMGRLQSLAGRPGSNVYNPTQQMLPAGTGPSGVPGTSGATGVTSANGSVSTPNLSSLVNPSLGGYGSLMQPYGEQFQMPTSLTEQNDPGYQARLNLGLQALQRSAAAQGGVLSGGELKDLNSYAQDYASNEYNNVYNRAYNNYATNYNQYEQNQTNQFNRLASIAGIGQTSANQLGMLGQSAADNISKTNLTTGELQGNDALYAGNARGSGYINQANALNYGIGGGMNNLSNLLLMLNGGSGGTGALNSYYNSGGYAGDALESTGLVI